MIRIQLMGATWDGDEFTGTGLDDDTGRTVIYLPGIPAPGHVIDLGGRGGWQVAAEPRPTWIPHDGGCTVRIHATRVW